MRMSTPDDSYDDFVVDTSLNTLFETAKAHNKGKSSKSRNPPKTDGEDDVEKLVKMLNSFANWELRSILVGILKDDKLEALRDRLLGKDENDGDGKGDDASTSSDESALSPDDNAVDPRMTTAKRSSNLTNDVEHDPSASHGQRSSETRRSGSIGRRTSRAGRLTRSLSADRKLDGARRSTKDAVTSTRQASILAKRRELDRLKHEAVVVDSADVQNEPTLVTTHSEENATRRNRSLSPVRTLRRHPVTESRSLGKGKKSGSADNLLGLSSASSHVPGSRRASQGLRGNKNATFNKVGLGTSLHGTSSTERSVSSRHHNNHSPMEGRHHTRRNSREQVEGHVSPTSFRRRVQSSTRSPNSDREVSTPPPVRLSSPERDSKARTAFSSNANEDTAFLQFNPGSDTDPLTVVATSSRALTNANDLVEELKSSSHDPINIVVGQPSRNEEVNVKSGSVIEKTAKKGFDFLLRRKRSNSHLEKTKDKANTSDHSAQLSCAESDEESFG